jgi:hypothetical protein
MTHERTRGTIGGFIAALTLLLLCLAWVPITWLAFAYARCEGGVRALIQRKPNDRL